MVHPVAFDFVAYLLVPVARSKTCCKHAHCLHHVDLVQSACQHLQLLCDKLLLPCTVLAMLSATHCQHVRPIFLAWSIVSVPPLLRRKLG